VASRKPALLPWQPHSVLPSSAALACRDGLAAQSLTHRALRRWGLWGNMLRRDRHPLYAFHEIRVAENAKRFEEL